MRVGLISCSKTKLAHAAPAKELYQGQVFKLARAWIEKRFEHWGILSASHGLVLPEQIVEPYDLCLSDLPHLKKERWANMVHEQLIEKWSEDVIFTIIAGADYRTALRYLHAEDVIGCWTRWRLDRGMATNRARIGIGVLKKLLKENTPYY